MLKVRENKFKSKLYTYSQYLLYDGKIKVVDFRVPNPDTQVEELKTLFLKCQNSTKKMLEYIKKRLDGEDIKRQYRGKPSDRFDIKIISIKDAALLQVADSKYSLCYVNAKDKEKSKMFAENILALLNGEDEVYNWTDCY